MEALFELIFGNIFILALVIGGLISLFRRTAGSESSETSGRREQEDRKQVSQEQNKRPADSRPTRPVPEAEQELSKPETPAEGRYESQMEELRKKQERARELSNTAGQTLAASSAAAAGKKRRVAGSIVPVTPENARQGVLWSEILGEPKAKRKMPNHGASRYQLRR
ncbi:hypothetical protein [Salibacterium sp. K-3]